ncbi:MAG: PKD domain-containing protein, partial [Sphingobacteriales bacterium]
MRSTRSYPNGGTCTAIAVKTVNILAAPVATFNSNASSLNCSPFNLVVNANSSEVTSIEWNFGDAGSATNTAFGLSANHIYSKAGDYVVT